MLLDALGTLVELETPWPLLVDAMRADHGVQLTPAAARRALRAEIAHYRCHNHRAGTRPELERLRRECACVLRDSLGAPVADIEVRALVPTLLSALRFRSFPEVRATLRHWRGAGLRLAIVSNWDISLHDVLDRCGLTGLLDVVVTSAETGVAKPDRGLFDIALRRLGVCAGQAVHVGDSYEQDVVGARSAGIEAVLIARGGVEDAPEDIARARSSGVAVVSSLADVTGI